MHSAIESMLETYNCKTTDDYKNALKEIVQEIALLGLHRGGFFDQAAFYGGTALRVFYGLDRFSEDLDFSLLRTDPQFDLSLYTTVVQDELGAFGLDMQVREKIKNNESPVKSAFIKGGTQIHLLQIASVEPPISGVAASEQLKIKMEVDTDPPGGADFQVKYQLNPIPYYVRLYSPGSLFAGKVHAILCRSWKSRVKGRDYYDFVWYLSKGIAVNLHHVRARMIQTGHLAPEQEWNETVLKNRLIERFQAIDFEQAKKDVLPFVKNPQSLNLWSADFFTAITRDKLTSEKHI
jgi:predicted nucleotidyltransferase component of viral defense system